MRPFEAAEASYFAPDTPTVVFRPGVLADENGLDAHADREYINASEIDTGTKILTEAILTLLSS